MISGDEQKPLKYLRSFKEIWNGIIIPFSQI